MIKSLIARLKQGYRTGTFPTKSGPNLPPDFRGRPKLDASLSEAELAEAAKACPCPGCLAMRDGVASLDMGRCLFCGRCAAVSKKIVFTKEYRLGVFRREDLIVKAGEGEYMPPRNPDDGAVKLLKRSFQIREVSAGGCAACELDFNVLGTLAWDLGRFGIKVVASPRQLTLDIMGTIQLEVLSVILPERFGLKVRFGQPKVVYKETVSGPAEGLAVYTMPKPCWAILKFLVEPLPTGSGIQYECVAPPAHLPYRYRRQVEQTVPRALRQGMMGWEVTDVKLTLIDGQDHPIHTHPLDFVLATPWAIMEALKNAGTQLLEPMLRCRISVPEDLVGRVMNEITLMRGEAGYPVSEDGAAVLTARIPAATSMDWPARLASMTQGRAVLASRFDGYRPCPNELGETCPRRSVSPLDRMKYILAMRNALEGGLRDEF